MHSVIELSQVGFAAYIINTPTAVVPDMVYDLPAVYPLPIYNSMTRIRKDWIDQPSWGRTRKCNRLFEKVILPLIRNNIRRK